MVHLATTELPCHNVRVDEELRRRRIPVMEGMRPKAKAHLLLHHMAPGLTPPEPPPVKWKVVAPVREELKQTAQQLIETCRMSDQCVPCAHKFDPHMKTLWQHGHV